MANNPTNHQAQRVIRRCRIIACLLPLGSVAALLVPGAVLSRVSAAEFLVRLGSPMVLLVLGLFYLIYLPASVRIYYVLLLNAKGSFTAAQRQLYREGKEKWDKYLLKAGLIAGISMVLWGVWALVTRLIK